MDKTIPYVHWRTILFGETDAAAIVYTTRFTDYCMEAAEVWFRDYLGMDWYQININQGMGAPVVHMELDFTASLVAGDKLGVEVIVAKTGRSTVTLEFEGLRMRGETEQFTSSFTAKFVFCFFSNEQNGAIPIPDEQRKLLEQYMAICGVE